MFILKGREGAEGREGEERGVERDENDRKIVSVKESVRESHWFATPCQLRKSYYLGE